MKNISIAIVTFSMLTAICGGCLSVKTEHEVKPIEINMNINLKMDKAVDEFISKEHPVKVLELLRNGAVGMDNKAMLVPQSMLSTAELEAVRNFNQRRKAGFEKIAKENNESYDTVASNAAKKIVEEKLFKGARYQNSAGDWLVK